MQKSVYIVLAILVILLFADHFYFREARDKVDGFTVNEAFFRKGKLGDILKDNALIKTSAGTETLATNDLCAADGSIKGYDYHNTYRLRFKIHSNTLENVRVRIYFPEAKRYREVLAILNVQPGRQFYTVDFVAHKNKDFQVTLTPKIQSQMLVSDILVDGRYGRTQELLKDGRPILGGFEQSMAIVTSELNSNHKGVQFDAGINQLTYSVQGGLGDALYSGVFPGKKNQGFCRYEAFFPAPIDPVKQIVVPTVNLSVSDEYLYGETGIVDNKEGKGRIWEVPAEYSVQNKDYIQQQPVGLRFHGGTPGRKKNIESFRINARDAYGKSEIDSRPLFGRSRQLGMKGVVFKYTYQAYDLKKTIYNPYNHALALDIGDAVGALVPAHQLVDLNLNDQSYGLYLAMEHLSKRSIKHWTGRDDLVLYTYKKFNNEHQQFSLLFPIGQILKAKGDAALDLLLESYDLDNVLGSIMLSAYIADDDYCQGIDVIEEPRDSKPHLITNINWDLDHAFLFFKRGKYSMPVQRKGIGEAFDILKLNRRHEDSLCPRKWVLSHVYTESKKFRALVRDRLESLLENELSRESIVQMIAKYRAIDEVYYEGRNQKVIEEMEHYAKERPIVLRQAIDDLEAWVEDGSELVY